MSIPDAPPPSSIKARPRRSQKRAAGVPYASATSDMKAREETKKLLRRFGCEEIGISDNYERHEILLYFRHHGREIRLTVPAKGWAQMYLKAKPWTYRHRSQRVEYEQAALRQGQIAANSMLRDWIKGQLTAIESGMLQFEAVFMPYMLTADGRTVMEHAAELLPKPDEPKVVALPKPAA
jgi:hypothetical protein